MNVEINLAYILIMSSFAVLNMGKGGGTLSHTGFWALMFSLFFILTNGRVLDTLLWSMVWIPLCIFPTNCRMSSLNNQKPGRWDNKPYRYIQEAAYWIHAKMNTSWYNFGVIHDTLKALLTLPALLLLRCEGAVWVINIGLCYLYGGAIDRLWINKGWGARIGDMFAGILIGYLFITSKGFNYEFFQH